MKLLAIALAVCCAGAAAQGAAMTSGEKIAEQDTCGDSDDVFVDAKRNRIYVSCGDGSIDVFAVEGTSYRRLARIRPVQPRGILNGRYPGILNR